MMWGFMNHTQIVKPTHAIRVKPTVTMMWKLQIILKVFQKSSYMKTYTKIFIYKQISKRHNMHANITN